MKYTINFTNGKPLMRNGIAHTCIDGTERDAVIFKEVEE